MFVEQESDPRADAPLQGDERATLLGFLKWQRDTLALKCSGLAPGDLARRAIERSSLSLLGLVRHMADVERSWFRRRLAGLDAPPHYRLPDADGDFDGAVADSDVVDEAWDRWREEISFADQFVAEAVDLDVVGYEQWRGAISLRWVLVHMIEEYARHNGHADLLRQRIDGRVGQ